MIPSQGGVELSGLLNHAWQRFQATGGKGTKGAVFHLPDQGKPNGRTPQHSKLDHKARERPVCGGAPTCADARLRASARVRGRTQALCLNMTVTRPAHSRLEAFAWLFLDVSSLKNSFETQLCFD